MASTFSLERSELQGTSSIRERWHGPRTAVLAIVAAVKDLRCIVALHAYPRPSKKHPVNAADVAGGRLTLTCPRCGKNKTIKWQGGPPKPDQDGHFPISHQNS